jgi:NTE family protein
MAERIDRSGAGRTTALVLSGGVALGAYHAGAYTVLHEESGRHVDWLAGSSIGAVTAAIIAGNPPARRVRRLRQFWDALATDPMPLASFSLGQPGLDAPWRRVQGWASALQARLLGRAGLFRPRLFPGADRDAPGLYDLAPMRNRLEEMIDFGLLNGGGAPRLSVVATDVASGERIVFDTRHGGATVRPEHLLASCALLPDFAPVEIDGRLLGDGGLSTNAPLDLVLDEPAGGDLVCFVLDLFAREGGHPRSLTDAAARALDLMFSGQSDLLLGGRQREHRLRAMIGRLPARLPPGLREDPEVAALLAESRAHATTVLHLAYRAPGGEADVQKTFDFSRTSLAGRWEAGARDMRAALRMLAALSGGGARRETGLAIHKVRS